MCFRDVVSIFTRSSVVFIDAGTKTPPKRLPKNSAGQFVFGTNVIEWAYLENSHVLFNVKKGKCSVQLSNDVPEKMRKFAILSRSIDKVPQVLKMGDIVSFADLSFQVFIQGGCILFMKTSDVPIPPINFRNGTEAGSYFFYQPSQLVQGDFSELKRGYVDNANPSLVPNEFLRYEASYQTTSLLTFEKGSWHLSDPHKVEAARDSGTLHSFAETRLSRTIVSDAAEDLRVNDTLIFKSCILNVTTLSRKLLQLTKP